jgi:type I restriction enzyme S subunit
MYGTIAGDAEIMKKALLGDYITGYSVKNKKDEEIPVYSVTNDRGFCTEYFSKDVSGKDKSKYKIVPRGYFAYNPLRINVGSVDWQNCEDRVIVSPLYVVFKTDERLNQEYLRYYLKSDIGKFYINENAVGAVRANLKFDILSKFRLPIPDIEEQKNIVSQLNLIDEMIKLKEKEITVLDTMIKARFVEMFGDCANKTSVNEICTIITDGTHQPPKFYNQGIPFILVSNLSNNVITYNTEKFINEETYEELIKRTPIEIGDVLLSTVGSYGHPAVVTESKKFLFQRHIAYMKPKHDLINSFYLHGAFLSSNVQRQIEDKVKGIAQKTLNLSEIRKIILPLPSIDEQNQYADFVQQVDKSKFEAKSAIEKLKILQKNLLQKYFC